MNLALPPPESEQTNVRSLLLSAIVHLLLLGALFFGVQWKSQAPSSVAVEVWRAAPAARPQPAPEPPPPRPEPKAEPKPEPKPVPKAEPAPTIKPDIAIKDDKKPKKEEPRKPEPKKEEPKKPEPKKEESKREEPKKPEPDRRQSMLDDLNKDLKQSQQQKAAQDQRAARAEAEANQLAQLKAEQAAAGNSRGLADWSDKVRNKIRNNIVTPPSVQGNPEAVFGITQLPSGEIIDVKLRKSSGHKALDDAIERAILKSSPLPKPEKSELYQRVFELKVKPLNE